ncbi:exopolysaccharide biosynthesis polyprenyl glycosylphosphotransferase [Flavobacterium sp. K77]|jgi:exopolysaccharide biosynthesis polyprenyl glycosylphosphotransferase|uniref:exopolysaccharide biosynthesis polyprenyl glycosylphosphotransferase n=1 Tax=Flavobacterium sp. K77 TaxID=2910676 RepID=UPI001F32E19F|nr:exopolysaccharide biosynthesis polyprenyl glycosylphosphotransferase [Flavobacterium sp. K77]MCF6141419.1 exopolysaccharide biosynthesis polyprenyl glycosylphosphotransferase [Flavobacterium sp. K77]
MFAVDKMHFEISERKMLLRLFDVFFVLSALYLLTYVKAFNYFAVEAGTYHRAILLAVYLNLFGTIFEMYNLQVASNQFQVLKSTLITASTTVLIYLLTPYFSPTLPNNRLQIALFFIVVFLSLFAWRMLYVSFLASNRFFQKAVLLCDRVQVEELIKGLENIDPHYKIIGFVPLDFESQQEVYPYVKELDGEAMLSFVKKHGVSELVIASQITTGMTTSLYQQLLKALESGIIIREYTQVYESKTQRIPLQHMSRDFYRFFPFSRSNQNKLYLVTLRGFDVSVAVAGLLVGLALLPLILLGNALANRGSLFYTQERVGKDGAVFSILKFRTMVKNAEENGAVFTKANDCRVTAFGKFMRKTRVDEFPQFINILKGDMAVIGPRPERPVFVKEIAASMPFYETRHIIKPGLTGWAQVNYSYGETLQDSLIKLQYDLYYIKHRSIYLDLNIAFKTITTVLFYRGQ